MSTYDTLIEPISGSIRFAGTLVLISLSLVWIEEKYTRVHAFFNPFVDLLTIAAVAWGFSRLFRQIVRIYGIDLLRRYGRQVDDILLVFETFINLIIGFIAILAFAQSQQFNLIGLLASFGLSGLAVAFAAQKILEQLLSTIVLYLDRPFVPGEYIRLANGQLGRVESIGLRSTKIRTPAKSTLLIIPNSNLISMEIENVTRAKKVMVMLYLDFKNSIDKKHSALVKQVISESTNSVFGIDPGSTSVTFTPDRADKFTQARITFFILGSSESSIALRKRLLELANKAIAAKLQVHNIDFTAKEPTIYVESPVTI
ncbi:mechanosensitive ion channel family protein [Synechococcus sp. PCC 7336]|uniref:mechanosensitive ion channel family protein n=1 Tax=Synechococcus sp. PCC 7336 TaxID=195250 RepID=UPI0003782114|nr:mechanosensitive ion channel domain-containing protein [Synechococcus sp. PCC 7336]